MWTFSAATLRRRFADLLAALGLPTTKVDGKRPFDLASRRPGGATLLLLESESPENVRRRVRWASPKVMDIYIQEVMYTTLTEHLPQDAKLRIQQLASVFPQVLDQALLFLNAAIPPTTWLRLFQTADTKEHGEARGKYGRNTSFWCNEQWTAGDGQPSHRR